MNNISDSERLRECKVTWTEDILELTYALDLLESSSFVGETDYMCGGDVYKRFSCSVL
jgi:hypothetical protein